MNPFEFDYIITSEHSPQEKVLCMRCGVLISDHRYEDQPKLNSPREIVHVYAQRTLGNYRQVPVLALEEGLETLMHILVCEGCQNFDVTPDLGDKILQQVCRAQQIQIKWAGYPEEALEAMRQKYASMKIVRRLKGTELVNVYRKENIHASDI